MPCVSGKCQFASQSPSAPMGVPERAWSRVHFDYAGPFEGRMFLIVIDAYSKWIEEAPVCHATSQSTIDKLRTIFLCRVFPKCWCQTMVHRSPVLSFKSLSNEMPFSMCKLLRIIRLPTDLPKEPSRHSSPR